MWDILKSLRYRTIYGSEQLLNDTHALLALVHASQRDFTTPHYRQIRIFYYITMCCDTTIILWTFFVIELEVARTMIYEHPPFFSLHLMKEA